MGWLNVSEIVRFGFQNGYIGYLKIGGRWRDHERWALRLETWRALRR